MKTLDTVPTRPAIEPTSLDVLDLGVMPYIRAWELQNKLAADLGSGRGRETLLLLEHDHTYTCGRRGGRDHILISQQRLDAEGIAVLDVDRGGDVTYHGPGQLVAYPIINLMTESGVDYHAYVRGLEAVLIDLLGGYGIKGLRIPGYTGVWVGPRDYEEKVAAIGVRVDGRGVSTHGVALNVTTDLDYFSNIVPCGISEKGVTSLARLLPDVPPMTVVKNDFVEHFRRVFGLA